MGFSVGLCPSRTAFQYPASLTSSVASSQASSVFSFDSTRSSQSSASSVVDFESFTKKHVDHLVVGQQTQQTEDVIVVPQEQRQNPRRCGRIGEAAVPVPSLVRQGERKLHFVDNLVDSAAQIVEAIWPLSKVACRGDASMGSKAVLPLRRFIEETLRRSRTSYSTLQVALYYLVVIRPHVPKHDFTMEQTEETHALRALMCGRRMFLAALILASKYLQDKTYSARAWSKLSGLPICEINSNEMIFLSSIKWRLHISEKIFQRWSDIVLKYTPTQPPASPNASMLSIETNNWRAVIPKLTRELDHPDILFSIGSRPMPTVSVDLARMMTPAYMPDLSPTSSLPSPLSTPCTPAVGVSSFEMPLRRPSIGSAMSQAQSACNTRMTMERFCFSAAAPPRTVISPPSNNWCGPRRSSLATTCSVSSSPESMVSDTSSQSSRSSRASSVSSVSSALCPPAVTSLAVQATCRNAKLLQQGVRQPVNIIVLDDPDRPEIMDLTSSPESYTADFSNFSLGTPCLTSTPKEPNTVRLCARSREYTPASPLSTSSTSSQKSRKRGRPVSIDNDLQCHVRQLMAGELASLSAAYTDARVSSATVTPTVGRKRACRTDEQSLSAAMARQPGFW